jgi:uncharacterized membrane protein HdeD (DUF308 family)
MTRTGLALRGVVAVAFGILTLIWPGITLDVLVLLFGAFVLVDSGFLLVAVLTGAPGTRRDRGLLIVEAVAGIAVGAVTLVWPGITALALLYLIAAWWFVTGGMRLATAWMLRRQLTRLWLPVLSGLLSVAAAIAIVIAPVAGALAITWLIGWWAILVGSLLLGIAWDLRRTGESLDRRVRRARHVTA